MQDPIKPLGLDPKSLLRLAQTLQCYEQHSEYNGSLYASNDCILPSGPSFLITYPGGGACSGGASAPAQPFPMEGRKGA